MPFGAADAEGLDLEPPAHRRRFLHEVRRLARLGDAGVQVDPVPLEAGDEFASRPAHRVHEPRVPLEGRVGFQKAIIGRPAGVVE